MNRTFKAIFRGHIRLTRMYHSKSIVLSGAARPWQLMDCSFQSSERQLVLIFPVSPDLGVSSYNWLHTWSFTLKGICFIYLLSRVFFFFFFFFRIRDVLIVDSSRAVQQKTRPEGHMAERRKTSQTNREFFDNWSSIGFWDLLVYMDGLRWRLMSLPFWTFMMQNTTLDVTRNKRKKEGTDVQ